MAPERCVSAIIVTYQSSACVGACLDSLRSTAGEWLSDIVVVDNSSTDDTVARIRSECSDVTLIGNPDNFGFGKAVNIGSRSAKGSLLLILNPDAVVQPGMVKELALFLRYRAEACACGPRIINADGVFEEASRRGFPTPWNAIGYLLKLDRLFPRSRRFGSYRARGFSGNFEALVDCLSGACMMVRKTCFDDIGGFDEDYFLFGEDIDLCWRLNRTGKEIWYIPTATLVHHKGESMRQAPRTAQHEFYRAMRLFFDKRLAHEYSRPLILAARTGISAAKLISRRYSNKHRSRFNAGSAHLERESGWPNKLQKPKL